MNALMTMFRPKSAAARQVATETDAGRHAEYIAILARGDSPKDGDADRLLELAKVLDISDDQVEADLAIVAAYRRVQDAHTRHDEVMQATAANRASAEKLRKKISEIEKELRGVYEEQKQLEYDAMVSGAAIEEKQLLELHFPALLGVEAVPAPVALVGRIPPASVVEKLREFGLPVPRLGMADAA